ncbi:Cytochrome c-type biogenesis protein CcmG/DsbE, thiol:disulfide oxidoreductase [hydrothermal vent metagenome]|uniref:Cytochrome c-type biogenesis protein CcmG/DsbE, thiol:disulfide oxidoreductase n=1 Tax=hydrothermal vent metagenome TaxID=652676 RepID=A0A3B1B7A7_9ZZZZ
MARFLIPLALFIALAIFLGIGLTRDPKLVPSPLIDKPAPAFEISRLYQPENKFSDKDFIGKVSILNVWASWCGACRQEHPFLMKLAKEKAITIYGLNYKDTREDAKRWLMEYGGNPYNVVGYDDTGRTGMDWGVYGVPETFVIDKKGVVRYKYVGPLHPQVWQDQLLPLIQKLQAES